jgi:outer membrane protein OmpA-like peptidoglycan-associated protein
LANKRVNYIKDILEKSINNIKITVKAYGEVELLNKLNIEFQQKENRRVEIIFSIFENNQVKIIDKNKQLEIKKQFPEIKQTKPNLFNNLFNNIKKGDTFILEDIIFIRGFPIIENKSKPFLIELKNYLKKNDSILIKITGFVSSKKYSVTKHNLAKSYKREFKNLSLLRGKFIYDFLTINGIDKNRLYYDGSGYQPLNNNKELNPQDRRVLIEIVDVLSKKNINPNLPKIEAYTTLFKTLKKNDVVLLKHLEFLDRRTILTSESQLYLNSFSQFLKKNKQYSIKLLGFYNGKKSKALNIWNKNLIKSRVKNIYNYLISKDINKERLSFSYNDFKIKKQKDINRCIGLLIIDVNTVK